MTISRKGYIRRDWPMAWTCRKSPPRRENSLPRSLISWRTWGSRWRTWRLRWKPSPTRWNPWRRTCPMWRPWSLRIGRMRTTRTPAAAVAAAPLWTTTISLKSSAPAAARTLSSTRVSWTLVSHLPQLRRQVLHGFGGRGGSRGRGQGIIGQGNAPAGLAGALSFLFGEWGDYPGVVPKTEWMPWTYRSQAAVSWASWTRPRWVMR